MDDLVGVVSEMAKVSAWPTFSEKPTNQPNASAVSEGKEVSSL